MKAALLLLVGVFGIILAGCGSEGGPMGGGLEGRWASPCSGGLPSYQWRVEFRGKKLKAEEVHYADHECKTPNLTRAIEGDYQAEKPLTTNAQELDLKITKQIYTPHRRPGLVRTFFAALKNPGLVVEMGKPVDIPLTAEERMKVFYLSVTMEADGGMRFELPEANATPSTPQTRKAADVKRVPPLYRQP